MSAGSDRITPAWMGRLALALLLLLPLAETALASDIQGVRFWRSPDYTRVIFDVEDRVEYSVFVLEDPHRVVIDISNARMRGNPAVPSDLEGSPILRLRSASRNDNDTRVVLDVKQPVNPTSLTLPPSDGRGHRLMVDLYDVDRAAPVREREAEPAVQMDSPRRDIVVAIDAGHGGHDPGAIGYDGSIREKDVALAIAQSVYDRLRQVSGYQPVMVRSGDYYVQLQQRPGMARQSRADIFLSIHADSFRSPSAEGVTVYALSQNTAQQENSRRVAERENAAALLGGLAGDTSLAQFEDDLALTLLDLSMSWSIEQSLVAGSHILDAVGSVARLRRDTTQRANLWVLRSPDIPSLLIETGYLSNPQEARRLTSPGYQRRLGDAIVRGVMTYFHELPPEGTLLAWQKQNGRMPEGEYTVQRGDSLSVIAQRHGVGLGQLRSANGLNGDVIHVGQRLTIPGSSSLPALPELPEDIEHTIRRGETLSGIAQQYRVSLSRLRQANDLRSDTIRIGQVLLIPAS